MAWLTPRLSLYRAEANEERVLLQYDEEIFFIKVRYLVTTGYDKASSSEAFFYMMQ